MQGYIRGLAGILFISLTSFLLDILAKKLRYLRVKIKTPLLGKKSILKR